MDDFLDEHSRPFRHDHVCLVYGSALLDVEEDAVDLLRSRSSTGPRLRDHACSAYRLARSGRRYVGFGQDEVALNALGAAHQVACMLVCMKKRLWLIICISLLLLLPSGCKTTPDAAKAPEIAAQPSAPGKIAKGQRDWRLSPLNGENLTKDCASSANTLAILCTGYLVGALDMLDSMEVSTDVPEVACVPADVTGQQMAKVIVKYGNDHPEELHLQGIAFTLNAFRTAWPCS